MNERERLEALKKHLEELNELKGNDEVENELENMPEVEGRVIEQVPKTKILKPYSKEGNYSKTTAQNEERGFLNVFILVLILIVFQIMFVLSLYFLLN